MNQDLTRYNLVTNFHCHSCGDQLRLSYAPKENVRTTTHEYGMTGAAKVEQAIFIYPCPTCISKPLADLEQLTGLIAKYGPKELT